MKIFASVIISIFEGIFAVSLFYYWKMSTTIEDYIPIFIAVAIATLSFGALLCFLCQKKPVYVKPSIFILLITMLFTQFFFSYSMAFTFEKWQNKPNLRQFMVAKLCDIQNSEEMQREEKYKKYILNSYTRAEARELLSTNSEMDSSDKFSFSFEDYDPETSEIKFEADIYYAYNGLDLRDYWLVLMYVKYPDSENWRLSRAEVFAEGETVYGLYG